MAEVVALAKAHGWTVIANDNSLHGACLLERIESHRWEYLARLVETEPEPPAPPFQAPPGLTWGRSDRDNALLPEPGENHLYGAVVAVPMPPGGRC